MPPLRVTRSRTRAARDESLDESPRYMMPPDYDSSDTPDTPRPPSKASRGRAILNRPKSPANISKSKSTSGFVEKMTTGAHAIVLDVNEVMEKPMVALALFVLGVVFIMLGSRQCKAALSVLEDLGIWTNARDSPMGFMVVLLVYFFVWFDIWAVVLLKRKAVQWYKKAVAAYHNYRSNTTTWLDLGTTRAPTRRAGRGGRGGRNAVRRF